MRTLAARVRTLVSAVALSVLAGVGSFSGTYRVLVWMSEQAVAAPVVHVATGGSASRPFSPPLARAAESPAP